MKILRKTLASLLAAAAAISTALFVQGCSPSQTDVAVVPQIAKSDAVISINPSTGSNLMQAIAGTQPASFVFNQGIVASSVVDAAGKAQPLQITTGLSTWTFSAPANTTPTLSVTQKQTDGSLLKASGNLSFGSCIWTITSGDGIYIFPGNKIIIEACTLTYDTAGRPVASNINGKLIMRVNSTYSVPLGRDYSITSDGRLNEAGYLLYTLELTNASGSS